MNAAAIIVGIDDYPHLDKLDGSVADALETVDWLLGIGVAPERIRLHLAPRTQPVVPAGVIVRDANRDAIWASMRHLQNNETGDILYVFLSGHGYYLARSGPIFLAQDWSADASSRNLDIGAYADYLRGLRFRNVLFVVDACQNRDVDSVYVSQIRGSPPDDASVDPRAENGLLLCCATEQDQYAPIVQGRGLLTRTLLAALRDAHMNLPATAGDALVFNWTSGEAEIDLMPLYQHVVTPRIRLAAQNEGHDQRPTMTPFGSISHLWRFVACAAPAMDTVPFEVDAEPLEGLDTIRIETTPPIAPLDLPLSTTPPMPFKGVAPKGRFILARCNPATGWEADPRNLDQPSAQSAVKFLFNLRKTPPDPDRDGYKVRVIDVDGAVDETLASEDLSDSTGIGEAGAGSPRVVFNKGGFDVLGNGAGEPALDRAVREARARLRTSLQRQGRTADLVMAAPGERLADRIPNLRVDLPEGGVPAIAGLLSDEPLVHVERLGAGKIDDEHAIRWSIKELSAHPFLRLDPGAYRIVVRPPWGEAAAACTVTDGAVAAVQLPIPVGRPPLRNRGVDEDVRLIPSQPTLLGVAIIELGDSVAVGPPGLPLLVKDAPEALRVEPYSNLPWSEWDMLIGAGRLQAVDLPFALRRLELASETPEIQLLRLALGYAAWAQKDLPALSAFIAPLSGGPYADSMDLQLLSAARTDRRLATLSGVPYLRWAYRLAQCYAPGAWPLNPPSAASSWAVYTEGARDSETLARLGADAFAEAVSQRADLHAALRSDEDPVS
ncbi:MAG: hypothetical protein ACI8U3_002142 [Brevundimonas sp.]|jgi:hypothetical protein|uniref:hypothetical protein n=1 Tax=Brevundimonas sp. TaxID=1871086 RepID=UPI0039E5BF93